MMLAVGGNQGVYLYDPTFYLLHHITMPPVTHLAWRPDGSTLTTAHEDGAVMDWTITAQNGRFETRQTIIKPDGVAITALAWTGTAAGSWLAMGSGDGWLALWGDGLDTYPVEQPIQLDTSPITALAWDGSTLFAATSGQLHQIDVTTGLQTASTASDGNIRALAIDGDQRLASGNIQGQITIHDASGTTITTLHQPTAAINDLAWSDDGALLAGASGYLFSGSELRLWSAETLEPISVLPGAAAFHSAAWRPRTHQIAVAGDDNMVRLLDADSGAVLAISQGHQNGVETLAWSPDGEELASGSDDGIIRIWDMPDGTPIAELQGHHSGVNTVAWSPNGLMIASAGWDRTVRIWMRNSGKVRFVLTGHEDRVWMVAWHPTEPILASASRDGTVRTWHAYSGDLLHTYESNTYVDLSGLAWNTDGSQIAAGGDDGLIRVWDTTSGDLLYVLEGHRRHVWSVAWQPGAEGQLLSGSWSDGTIRLWDMSSGQQQNIFFSSEPVNVLWSPGGRYISSSHHDGVIRIWDVTNGTTLSVLQKHRQPVYALAWHPAGTYLASGGLDGTIRIWGS